MLYHTLQSDSNQTGSCDTYLGVYEYQVEEDILDVVSYLCGLPTLLPVEEPCLHPLFCDAHNAVAFLVNVRIKYLRIKLSQLLYD